MKIFLSHKSALMFWREHGHNMRIAPANPLAGQQSITAAAIKGDGISILSREPIRSDTPPRKLSTQKGSPPTEAPTASLLLKAYNLGARFPIDILFSKKILNSSNERINQHVLRIDAPPGSFIKVSKDVVVCSPEFCFLQMANQLELPTLILLGYELCGTYTVSATGSLTKRDAITTVKKLLTFVEKMPRAPGHKKAQRALRYIREGAASPMEARLAMLLTLPYKLGGYGLPYPELNRVIVPPKSMRTKASKSFYRCDLYWPEIKLDVEYDSDAHHLGSERISADAKRRNELDSLGVTVIVVTKELFYDLKQFDQLARQIAAKLHKKLRFDPDNFTGRQLELRKAIVDI